MSVTLPSGETRSLYVDVDTFRQSVHGNKLSCTDCHQDMTSVPHEARPFKTLRDFTLAYYEQCKRCHFANYTKTLDSVHFKALERGDRMAPTCVDCHGAHDIAPPHKPKAALSQTCARCHQGVFERLREERPRPLPREERRRAGVHRLPQVARRGRARATATGRSARRSCAAAATRTRR